ncbi:MAG: NupC/NupG family nucleoside CNT transporter [Candidatus Azotimanducaceae bacterium]
MQALIGIIVILFVGWLLSSERSMIRWRFIFIGLALQFGLAILFLKVAWITEFLMIFNGLVTAIEQATRVGTEFMFGFLGGGDLPFEPTAGANVYFFAFRVLPQILVFSVVVAIFWHWGVLPFIVRILGTLLRKGLNISGVLGTAASASLFLGMVEAPLVIRAYLKNLSRSEFFAVMTCGMSTIAGTMMVIYATIIKDVIPNGVGHLLAASIINIIGAIYLSRLIRPELENSNQEPTPELALEYSSFMDAVTRGTSDGLTLAMHIGAMLLVLSSLVALTNGVLDGVSFWGTPLSLEYLMGLVFAPVAWLIGIPWQESQIAGSIMGTKIVLNEMIAYLQMVAVGDALTKTSQLVMTYVLCGFANIGSLGILIGGLAVLVPERREEYLAVAPLSILSGTLVTLMSGAIVALISAV